MAYKNNQNTKNRKKNENNNDSTPRKGKKYGKKYDKASKYFEGPEYLKKKISEPKFEKPKPKNRSVDGFNVEDINGVDTKSLKLKKISKPIKKNNKSTKFKQQEGVRLNKYIANAGICSRREADTFISAGLVSVNGEIVTELGVKVMPGDEVKFNDEKINPERKVYILLNKPKDYVTTLDDPEGRRTVMDLIQNACKERVYPVGRLDRNTTGLLLLTNDGELTKKLTHPSYNKKKIYHVELDKALSRDHLNQIAQGIELEDGPIVVDAISYVDNLKTEVGIELHSGKNRIVRRIMEHFGYNVKRLDRVYFAGLTKLNLPRGRWRFLSDQEVIRLKTGMYE
ncbi:MAG: rRNA pseudouridine synthase [Bacteroidales bacterium]|jgi:23S rRNA pseudouridine2605 synthase|nr:rRNA pseudouridine synthase [Bacteroidales bacterium]